jgi:hypothetical protein
MKILALLFVSLISAQAQTLINMMGVGVAGSTVATPTYNNDTGSYVTTVSVTISDATGGAAIIYCTNVGSDCSPVGGTSYTTPVTITVTATHLCSYATHAGLTSSATKCGTYTITVGGSGPAWVNEVCWPTVANTTTTSGTVNMAGTNFFIANVATLTGPGSITITDSLNSGYAVLASVSGSPSTFMVYKENASSSSSMTFTATASSQYFGVCVDGFSGVITSGSFESGTNHTTLSSITTAHPGSVTPGSGHQLIVTGCSQGGLGASPASYTIDSGFSTPVTQPWNSGVSYPSTISYLIQPSGTTVSPQWTTSDITGNQFACSDAAFTGQ